MNRKNPASLGWPVRCALVGLVLALASALAAHGAPLSDIATIQGVRSNPVVGYGLVVGLSGSGDQTTQTPFTGQAVRNMLTQLGITVPTGTNMQLKNVAAVMVTADLPAFAGTGQTLDVTVSSIGNADSLRGGTLLLTPLKGADGRIYALAQGNVLAPGISAGSSGSSVQVNQTTAARIPSGAIIERTVASTLGNDGSIRVELKQASFDTAMRTMNAINRVLGSDVARALDARTIEVRSPADASSRVAFLARVQGVDVDRGRVTPKVVINSRTGSVVMNTTVTLNQAAVAHGNLSVVIDSNPIVSQPNALSGGQTAVVPNADVSVQEGSGTLRMISSGATLREVVHALNQLGATPTDLMAILEALKSAGALNADLKVI